MKLDFAIKSGLVFVGSVLIMASAFTSKKSGDSSDCENNVLQPMSVFHATIRNSEPVCGQVSIFGYLRQAESVDGIATFILVPSEEYLSPIVQDESLQWIAVRIEFTEPHYATLPFRCVGVFVAADGQFRQRQSGAVLYLDDASPITRVDEHGRSACMTFDLEAPATG